MKHHQIYGRYGDGCIKHNFVLGLRLSRKTARLTESSMPPNM